MKNLILILSFAILFVTNSLSQDFEVKEEYPRNIILIIGDGMGLGQISAAMIENGGELNLFRLEKTGFIKTHAADNLITDSGASGTAMATGVKTNNKSIGVNTEGQPMKSLIEIAEENDMATGIIVTSSITHATPAAFYAHEKSRYDYENIAMDLLEADIDVIVGGGMKYFSDRSDNVDLILKFRKNKYKVIDDITKVKRIRKRKTLALVADDHLKKASKRGDYMQVAFERAFRNLNRNKNGFFLMIEGSQIDWACHNNDFDYLMEEMNDLDQTVGKIMDFLGHDKKTLIIVLADHETGGLSVIGGSYKKNKAKVDWGSKEHTAELIPVFAHGPGAELFSGVYDNTDIYKKIKQLMLKL